MLLFKKKGGTQPEILEGGGISYTPHSVPIPTVSINDQYRKIKSLISFFFVLDLKKRIFEVCIALQFVPPHDFDLCYAPQSRCQAFSEERAQVR